jgi:hypothetical protein
MSHEADAVKITSTCTTMRRRWFKMQILALDSKSRLLHLGRLCTVSIVLRKAEEPGAEFLGWHRGQNLAPMNGAAVEGREVLLFFDCAPPMVLDDTEPTPLKNTTLPF